MVVISKFLFAFVVSLCFSLCVLAQTHSPRSQAKTPEEQLAGFTVADGFVIELVASEREGIVNPIDITFDDAGRLWTQTATMYPLDPVADIQWYDLLALMDDPEAQSKHPSFRRIQDLYKGVTKGNDKILILSNLFGKGPIQSTVWAEGLTIPQSILPYRDGAFVAQGSELFLLKDTDQNGKADQRIPFFTGFGFTDTHTMAHTLVRGPGNWVHFSHGALNKGEVSSLLGDLKLRMDYSKIARFALDGRSAEIVSSGLNNIWGFQLRHTGEWYGSEANDLGYSIVPMEPGTGFPGIGNERIRPYQPWMPPLHDFKVGGTGISGLAFADDLSGSFPEEWDNVAFLANPITNSINAVRIVRKPDGTVVSEHLPDLLRSQDDWFRPVNIEFGPDGSLYIADWYNKIVSHNELPTTHPDRDKNHGRIWRIRHVSQIARDVPNFYQTKTRDLVDHLSSPSLWAKRAAWHQIADRDLSKTKVLAKELIVLAMDDRQDDITRIHALWSLESIRHYEETLAKTLLQSPSHHLRREMVRSLGSFALAPAVAAGLLEGLVEDASPMVRAQVIRTLAEIGKADQQVVRLLVQASKPEIPGEALGGAYERKFERYLARKALEQYPEDLKLFLASPAVDELPAENIGWAILALPKGAREPAFAKWWAKNPASALDQHTFVGVAQMLENAEVYEAIKPFFSQPANAWDLVQLALQNQAQVQSKELTRLLEAPVRLLLQSEDELKVHSALDLVGRFDIKNVREQMVEFVHEQSSERTLSLVLDALEKDPKTNEAIFRQVFQDKNFGWERRAAALHVLTKASLTSGKEALLNWLPELSAAQKRELTQLLSSSSEGVNLLLSGYGQKGFLGADDITLPTAERIHQNNLSEPRGAQLLEEVNQLAEQEKQLFDMKLKKYMAIADQQQGDIIKGKTLFQTCMMCHSVGNEGQDIAPALDGSGHRENEALLTAIIDPDAAVESNYAVYRISKKDGSSLEGYLVSQDERGTTLAFMGGNRIFVESGQIRSQGFLGGRSFMMKGLMEGYSDEQVADLLAYIRSLK